VAVLSDPEGNETRALFGVADLAGKKVLEIGCGYGRLTMLYAEIAAHVTAIDPFDPWIQQAKESLPANLKGHVDFRNVPFEVFATQSEPGIFDRVILSWSL